MPRMSNDLYSRIKQRLDELGMSEREASLAVAGNSDLIRNIKRQRSDTLRGPRLLKLAGILGVSAEWLATGESGHIPSEDVAASMLSAESRENNGHSTLENYKGEAPGAVPEIDARAGAGDGSVGESEIVSLRRGESYVGHKVTAEWVFPSTFLRHELRVHPGDIMVLEVVGDSMSPTLESGDRVIIDTRHARPTPDGVYVIDEGDGPMVKRLQLIRRSEPTEIRVISDNKNHEAYTLLLDQVRIIGRVSGRVTRM
jgi:phage repressor protein C with HTH and peptisase S24 domain